MTTYYKIKRLVITMSAAVRRYTNDFALLMILMIKTNYSNFSITHKFHDAILRHENHTVIPQDIKKIWKGNF